MSQAQREADTLKWAESILKALKTGDQAQTDDPIIRSLTKEEWEAKLPRLRKQFGVRA